MFGCLVCPKTTWVDYPEGYAARDGAKHDQAQWMQSDYKGQKRPSQSETNAAF